MKLLNPIYDASFKHLMQDARVACFFLSILLGKEIEIEGFQPQEIAIRNEERNTGYSTPRMDFIAIIKEEINGEIKRKKVLIELQQCLYASDINRFRTYLGKNYSLDVINGKKESLEIICIYILAFSIGTPCAVVKTSLALINAATGEKLDISKDEIPFISGLNHQSFVIDVKQLNDRLKTKVDKLLAIFNPKYVNNPKTTITLPDDIAQEIKALNNKQEKNNPIIPKLENALQNSDVLYAIEQQELFDMHILSQEQKAEQRGKLEGEKQKSLEIARNLKVLNVPLEAIIAATGLSLEEINKL